MGYVDRYLWYYNQLEDDIQHRKQSGRRTFLAFTSNYDVVLKWDAGVFSSLMDQYLEDEPSARPGDRITCMRDFARISAYCAVHGLGMNFDITRVDVCDLLMDRFDKESSLGGTGAQGAAALSTAGFPVAVQLTDRCREVCSMLNQSDTRMVQGQQLIPVMDGALDEEPVYHIILQFSKGDIIRIHGRDVTIPLSNRLIFFYDSIHKSVPVPEDYLRYLPAHRDGISSLVISGFDAIIDPEIMRQRAAQIEQMMIPLTKAPGGVPVYMEGAFYMNPEVKEIMFRAMGPYLTVLGTNEEELADLMKRHGREADLSDPRRVIDALEYILRTYGPRGAILHTKDYALFYGTCHAGADIEKGLTIGCLMSGTRARCGRYGTMQDLRESLSLPLSAEGLRFHDIVEGMKTDRQAVIVPSRYMERPLYTIGLGDTFVGGVQTCFA
ncbi:MAG: hypothetical protein J6E32_05075 [Lachnospiraceae bacterium]|nr:hypothetical protein [Lachnospiraceae bacterium]